MPKFVLTDVGVGRSKVTIVRLTSATLDLIDEYRLYIYPVLLGWRRPLFGPEDDKTDVDLIETRTFGNGVALLRYAVHTPMVMLLHECRPQMYENPDRPDTEPVSSIDNWSIASSQDPNSTCQVNVTLP